MYETLGGDGAGAGGGNSASRERRKSILVYALCVVFLILAIAVLVVGIAQLDDASFTFKAAKKNDMSKYSIVPAQKKCSAKTTLGYSPFYSAVGLQSSSNLNGSAVGQGYGGRMPGGQRLLLVNANLVTMDPQQTQFVLNDYQLAISENGYIAALGPDLSYLGDSYTVIDLQGAYVTPGIIDTHSHSGVYAFPDGSFGTSDGNELTNPSLSQIRALDAFDAGDPAIPLIRRGGVTTALVLPGSGDVMGGQAQVFKYRDTYKPNEMFLQGAKRGAKFACGENPKRVYGNKGVLPMSRMGIGYEVRRRFFEAAAMNQRQSLWDCQNASSGSITEPRPFSLELETLQGIINGNVDMHNHCYKVEDLMMMMRTAGEFGFRVKCFHHGLEAWKIANYVAAHGAAVATFADHWGFKLEGYDGSVYGPRTLAAAGVRTILKSDHPVIPAWKLIHEAGKSAFYGLSDADALGAITSVPADVLEIANQVGSLKVGLDADLVVWDRYPLELGAQATRVYVEGAQLVSNPLPTVAKSNPTLGTLAATALCDAVTINQQQSNLGCYSFEGAASVYTMDGSSLPQAQINIVVENGVVTCLNCTPPVDCGVVSVPGSIIVPGFVQVGTHMGLLDVASESGTQDGVVSDLDQRFLRAIDGVRFNIYKHRHLDAAFKAGVLTHIVHPQSNVLIAGQSGAYATSATVITDAIVQQVVALDINVGQAAKYGGVSNSISSQYLQLRKIFSAMQTLIQTNGTYDPTDPVALALKGQLPVVLHSNNADETATFITTIKQPFGLNLILLGGAESYLITGLLAQENVSVVLSPAGRAPNTFSVWDGIDNLAATLQAAGINVAIAMQEMDQVRNLPWDAGLQVAHGFTTGLQSITYSPAHFYGLDQLGVGVIRPGTPARFLAYSADPLTFYGHLLAIGFKNSILCQPTQY